MKNNLLFLFIAIIAVSATNIFGIKQVKPPSFYKKFKDYFSSVPQIKFVPVIFKHNGLPLIEVEIEKKCYLGLLDLGSYEQMSLKREILKKITKKEYGVVKFSDFKGNEYFSSNYLIPKIKIGNHSFSEVVINEMNEQFDDNVAIYETSEMFSTYIQEGIIGRALLKRTNIFLDFSHSRIAFIDNIHFVEHTLFTLENMLVIPYKMTSIGIVLDVQTSFGCKKLILDSGSTLSAIKASQCRDCIYSKDERGMDYLETSLVIEEKDFGNMRLYLLDIKTEGIDGVLGMDFLQKYPIYIDFTNHLLYLKNE